MPWCLGTSGFVRTKNFTLRLARAARTGACRQRVVRALTAGTLERRYADGKKETVNWKPGMVQVLPPSGAYTTKNVGKTKLQLYVVAVK